MSQVQAPSKIIQTGFLATLVVLILSGLLIAGFTSAGGTPFFVEWVGYYFLCATPFQVVMAVVWGNQFPAAVGRMPQPLRGFSLTVITAVAGAIVAVILFYSVGRGVMSPVLIHYAIQSVGITLLVTIVFGCWPVSRITNNTALLGLGTLVYCYLLNFVVFALFYDYSFLAGAPFFAEIYVPAGLFNGIIALTFLVTFVAMVMVLVMFELWPASVVVKGGSQPAMGIVGMAIVLLVSLVLYLAFVSVLGMEPMDFMVKGPVCIIFGAFLADNIMQFQLFSGLAQPLRGFAKTLFCLAGAFVMYNLYAFALPFFVGYELAAGPAANYAQEIWIATALLGITFPVINIVTGAFDFWPIKRANAVDFSDGIIEER